MEEVVSQIKPHNPLQVLELTGNQEEIGFQFGARYKHAINHFLDWFYNQLQAKMAGEQALRHASKYIPYIEEYSSFVVEEMKGIAKGSERQYEEMVMLSLHEEIQGFTSQRCTSFAATGGATVGGETYVGQNWDESFEHYGDGEFPLLLDVRPSSGPNYLAYSYPGIPAAAGLNSSGIGLSWNSVPRLELSVGVPTYTIIAEILHQKTIGDALGAIIKAKRAGCFNLVLGDGNGEIYDIEATPSDLDIHYSDMYLGHANHYVSDPIGGKQKYDMLCEGRNSSTLIRHNRMNRLLKQGCGNIDLEACMAFLKDHVNYPYSICRHPDPQKEPKERGITYDSWVMLPRKREWWISHGPPCTNKFIKYSVR
jgi:isopenicillin-N N-acyltransferase-like protein